MPRKIDVERLKLRSRDQIIQLLQLYDIERVTWGDSRSAHDRYVLRWVAQMTAVELHATWERYVEDRLVAALNHDPKYFFESHSITGVKRMPAGLAKYSVRDGKRFFDFKSIADLTKIGNNLLGKGSNPFAKLSADEKKYIDALATIRNCIVHKSEGAVKSYKKVLKDWYGIKSVPNPGDFLYADDSRKSSPARNSSRLNGLATVVERAITKT